ncbi:uncharacterized protein LAESUDRAFT_731749 [Laetiporus sulphureus 93-53]|uniref:Uncharacterized protein n=1 Tax=Laetiporus sulphureus 93-53 TaxID=1314785 RepID=A0A165BF27_9APHY|nr:uncharacterized protein LAESUDRAFT_731749 [Laetiporus sulphureus 93-53]KZT00918.1 hypothetical protein LAESUDRAFT_731749 [Laetiporus sulphureus 93-53]
MPTHDKRPLSFLFPTAYQREPAQSFNRNHCPHGGQPVEPFTQTRPICHPLPRSISTAHERVDVCRRRRPRRRRC